MAGITFGTDGWRARLSEFTGERVRRVAQAIADVLREERAGGEVVVGYDAREGSPAFAEAVTQVLAANGFDVCLPERDCPTPLVAYAIRDRDARGGVMLTASHNPPAYNGIKFVPSDAAPALPTVTDRIEARLRPPAPRYAPDESGYGRVERADFVAPHATHARRLVAELLGERLDLSDAVIAYDAIHGSGRGVTDALLESAGATVRRLRCATDPTFGGASPEPAPENLAELRAAVTDGPAEFGVANDGDADRLAVVTPDRGVVDENLFYAATYEGLLATNDGPAVRTVSTTFLIDRIADSHGERVVETPVGFKWVADAMRESDALVGGEESGGFTVRGHVRLKDGVLMALLAAALHARESYDDRIDRLTEAYGERVTDRVSVDCPDEAKGPVVDALGAAIPENVAGRAVSEVSDADGFKLLLADDSWLLVRPSGTEPKMRVYAESDSRDGTDEVLAAGRELVERAVADHQ